VAFLTVVTAVLARLHFPIQSIIALLTLAIVVSELFIHRRATPPYRLRIFFGSFVLLLLGAVCSALDVTRRLCDPTNHVLTGHGAWHVLSALSLLVAFYHYKRYGKEPWLL
jgi:hypothetical protein